MQCLELYVDAMESLNVNYYSNKKKQHVVSVCAAHKHTYIIYMLLRAYSGELKSIKEIKQFCENPENSAEHQSI